jgi:glycerol-3-phosphate dehydrogenase
MGYTPHVLVVGGGVLGTAIARDFAIRGLEVTLVEQGRLSAGTTGRMHGVLYGGARFATEDPSGARWCQDERDTLQRIADHCIEERGGVILPGPEADLSARVAACEEYDLAVSELSADPVESDLPGVANDFERALESPEGVVDPFRLTLANAAGAREFGAEIETGAEVVGLLESDGQITGVEVEYGSTTGVGREPTSGADLPEPEEADDEDGEGPDDEEADPAAEDDADTEEAENSGDDGADDGPEMPGQVQRSFPGASGSNEPDEGEHEEIEADFVVNAAGAWADRIAALAGIELPVSRTRNRLLVLEGELVSSVVTGRTPSGARLTVTPYQGNTVVGPVPPADGGDPVDSLLSAASDLVPAVADARLLRSYSGVWTQHASKSGSPDGPGVTLVDHGKYDDKWGMTSVVGGTLTTHRLVAEKVVDRVCAEFGIDRACHTDEIPLPGSSGSETEPTAGSGLAGPPGTAGESDGDSSGPNPVLCESRAVTRDDVRAVLQETEEETDLANVRVRTGATMGACQGGRCAHRIAAELHSVQDPETVEESLTELLDRRWRGRREVLRADPLAAAMRDYELHARVFGRDRDAGEEVDIGAFDDGTGQTLGPTRRGDPDPSLFDRAGDLAGLEPLPGPEDDRSACGERVVA